MGSGQMTEDGVSSINFFFKYRTGERLNGTPFHQYGAGCRSVAVQGLPAEVQHKFELEPAYEDA